MKQKTKPQLERFKEAARELGCDESEERFNENLKRIADASPVYSCACLAPMAVIRSFPDIR